MAKQERKKIKPKESAKAVPKKPTYVNKEEYFSTAEFKENSISRSQHGTTARQVGTGSDLKGGFNRWDYYSQRPEDSVPVGNSDIILTAQNFYRKIGLVRNIIDLMGDFASEGLIFKHPVRSQERFYREWGRRVDIQGRAHDFMKLLLRDANVICRRKLAKIPKKVADEFSRAFQTDGHGGGISPTTIHHDVPGLRNTKENTSSEPPDQIEKVRINQDPKANKREIPWKYTFLNPVFIEKIGGRVGSFVGGDDLGIRLHKGLVQSIRSPRTDAERELVRQLPLEVLQAAKENTAETKIVKLDMNRLYVDYYKKDDWEEWGTPFLYSVMEDILFKEKMRLADIAALDGVINSVRVWKLGDHSKDIFPTSTAVDKLLEILSVSTGGGMTDIVWDSMLEVDTIFPPIQDILGGEKYQSVDADIVRGIGIPDSLIGGSELSTRNAETAFIQLKTLVERLEYVRRRCIEWMNVELKLVADAMGFKKIPRVEFGTMSLRDEAAEKDLIIRLAERNLISAQAVMDVFGYDFTIETGRMKDEEKFREKNPGTLEKANPYYRPKSQMELQTDLTNEEATHKANLDARNEVGNPGGGGGDNNKGDQPKDTGKNPAGRPNNSRDEGPRDRRTPRVLSVYKVRAEKIIKAIDDIVDPLYLEDHEAKNMRFLTADQKRELEQIKRIMLATVNLDDVITQSTLLSSMASENNEDVDSFNAAFSALVETYTEMNGKMPNLSERRSLSASAWASLRGIE